MNLSSYCFHQSFLDLKSSSGSSKKTSFDCPKAIKFAPTNTKFNLKTFAIQFVMNSAIEALVVCFSKIQFLC